MILRICPLPFFGGINFSIISLKKITCRFPFFSSCSEIFGSDSKIVKCLKHINKKYKKIIIENSGDLNLKKRIEKNFVNTKVIISKNNGYGAANNLGANNAQEDAEEAARFTSC